MGDEFEILKLLANGVNPITGEILTDDTILNDPRIIRSLFNLYLKFEDLNDEIRALNIRLQQNTASGVHTDKKKKLEPFKIPKSKFNDVHIGDSAISLSHFLENVNEFRCEGCKALKNADLYSFLVNRGILVQEIEDSGSKRMVATESASQFGVNNEIKRSPYGKSYNVVTYNGEGQNLIREVIFSNFAVDDTEQ